MFLILEFASDAGAAAIRERIGLPSGHPDVRPGGIITTAEYKQNTPTDVSAEYFASATPGKGAIIYEAGYDAGKRHAEERACAEWLHRRLGGDITLLNESQSFGVKTPDYVWRGAFWELKSISTTRAIDDAVRRGLKQITVNPGGIILDCSGGDISVDDVREMVAQRFIRGAVNTCDVIVKLEEETLLIWRYKK